MRVAEQSFSIKGFRDLGAMEIYNPADLVAFANSQEPDEGGSEGEVPDDTSFRLDELFEANTKFLRQLWLARQPGVLPMALMHRFGLAVAQRTVERLRAEEILSDVRLSAALSAQAAFLDGERHARSIEPMRDAVLQAVLDHRMYGTARAADGCATVYAALDRDGHEAGAQAAYLNLRLFPEDQKWLRSELLALVRSW